MGLNIGANPISDMYVGGSACDRIYKGSDLLFDANSEVQGLSPIYFQSRANVALKNYRVYGVSGGAGERTRNLFDQSTFNFSDDTTIVYEYFQFTPNSYYTMWTSFPYNATSDVFIRRGQVTSVSTANDGVSEGHPRTVLSDENGWITIATRYNSNRAKPSDYNYTLVDGQTAPNSFIPYGYEIPVTNEHSGETESYNLYIGESKLEEEEYVDYQEQKVYKNTPNIFDYTAKDANKGYVANAYIKTDGATVASSNTWVSEYIEVAEGETYAITNFSTSATAYAMCRYDASKNFVSGSPTKFLSRTDIPSGVKYIRITVPNSLETTASIKLDRQIPANPPTPFPSITVSKGNNKISSSTTVGEICVKGRISNQPLGYVMTQTNYDVLSPQQKYGNKYFAIYNSGTSGSIASVYRLTQTEYDDLTEYDNTGLYIIETSGTISNAYVGANQLDALYLGAVQLMNGTPVAPYWVKRVADYAKQEFSGTPKTTFYVNYNQDYNVTPSNGELATVYFFDTLSFINFTSISSQINARAGSIIVTYSNGTLSWSSKKPYQNNLTISPPTYAYNNGQMICTSNFDVKLNGATISTNCDWS